MSPRTLAIVLLIGVAATAPAALRADEIASVTPRLAVAASAAGAGGTSLTIAVRDLDATTTAALTADGGRSRRALLAAVTDARAGTISGRVPDVAPGLYDVILVSTRLPTIIDTLPRAVEVTPPLRITSVSPPTVSRLGGTRVVIRGENLRAATEVYFAAAAVADPTVNAEGTEIAGIAPARPQGAADGPVMVTAEDSRGTARLPDGVSYGPPADPLQGPLAKLRGGSSAPIAFQFDNGRLRHVIGRFAAPGRNAAERARGFLLSHADLFGLDDAAIVPCIKSVSPPEDGIEHVRFFQTYKGIPVRGAGLVVALAGNDVLFSVGAFLPHDERMDATPRISESQAIALARRAAGLPDAVVIGTTRIEVFDAGLLLPASPPAPTLAWRVSLGARTPQRVWIDAIFGATLVVHDLAYESGGSFHGFDYDLYDAENEATAASTSCFELASNPHAASENGYDNGYQTHTEAKVAHPAVRNTYRFYHDELGRHSYDDDSAYFEAYFNSTAPNAQWTPWPCNLFEMRNGFADQEIITHELTHGVIRDESDLDYINQSGALNEHYADVMAVILDRMLDQQASIAPNWLLAENRTSGNGAIRDLQNPTRNHYSMLDITQGCNGTYDNGGVHCNSGIGNQAAYLMVEGGTVQGNTTSGGLSLAKLMRVKYAAIKYLDDDAKFIDARNLEVSMAQVYVNLGYYGFTQLDVCRVKSAWAVVGLGKGDFNCDGVEEWTNPDSDGDEIPDSIDNCDDVANPTQANKDWDAFGDACDSDIDNDGYPNGQDGCPTEKNLINQWAPCDDDDFDGVKDNVDNCPENVNPGQEDADEDGVGNICEPDTDGDGIEEDHDNCPKTPNPRQENSDGDFFGDACDLCPDVWEIGAFTPWGTPFQKDTDEDGIPDACDESVVINGANGWASDALASGSGVAVRVRGRPESIVSIPFEICPDGDCPEWYEPAFRLGLGVRGGGPGASFWISDGDGGEVARLPKGAVDGDLVFKPLGDETYSLNVWFHGSFAGDAIEVDAFLEESDGSSGAPRFRRADTNADTVVDISDAVRTFGFLFLGAAAPTCLDAADANDDGSLDIADGVFTLLVLFQGAGPLPPPGRDACGVDPTASIGCDDYPEC